ncbi:MAG: CxxC-x17-CxxC domain-containing protein [Patescibacteria group bacterium]
MKNFSRDRRSGGGNRGGKFNRRDGGRRDFRGDRDGSRSTMYPATCAECGNPCEVPFEPRSGRPVFCNNCFDKGGNRDHRRPDTGRDRQMFAATCAECGNPCEVPFRPSAGKPVYCKDCFGKRGKGRPQSAQPSHAAPGGQKDLSGQFKSLNEKLDAILHVLKQTPAAKPTPVPSPAKVKVKAKTKKKAK